jgi:hypothetical protein
MREPPALVEPRELFHLIMGLGINLEDDIFLPSKDIDELCFWEIDRPF